MGKEETLPLTRRVGCVTDRREVRWRDSFVVDIIKVYVFEEQVSFNVLCVGFACSQSACRISREELASVIANCMDLNRPVGKGPKMPAQTERGTLPIHESLATTEH